MSRPHNMSLTIALGAAIAISASSAARADRIDGDWCATDGRHVHIDGPAIVTPGGARMTGDYSRHNFSYVIPAPEKSAGATLYMILLNETTMRSREGDDATKPTDLWRRCDATS